MLLVLVSVVVEVFVFMWVWVWGYKCVRLQFDHRKHIGILHFCCCSIAILENHARKITS